VIVRGICAGRPALGGGSRPVVDVLFFLPFFELKTLSLLLSLSGGGSKPRSVSPVSSRGFVFPSGALVWLAFRWRLQAATSLCAVTRFVARTGRPDSFFLRTADSSLLRLNVSTVEVFSQAASLVLSS